MSKMIAIFQLTSRKLIDQASLWGFVFLAFALTVGVCYYVLGYSSNALTAVSYYLVSLLACCLLCTNNYSILRQDTEKNIFRIL